MRKHRTGPAKHRKREAARRQRKTAPQTTPQGNRWRLNTEASVVVMRFATAMVRMFHTINGEGPAGY